MKRKPFRIEPIDVEAENRKIMKKLEVGVMMTISQTCILCGSDSQLLKWKIKGKERIVCNDCIDECWKICQYVDPDRTRWRLLDILDLSLENYSHFLKGGDESK